MERIPDDDESREPPRKAPRRRQSKQSADLDELGKRFNIKAESKESGPEIEARLKNEAVRLAHELKKDEKTFNIVASMLVFITLSCLFAVLSNRYSATIQSSAFALLSAIISGVVVYLKGKPEKS